MTPSPLRLVGLARVTALVAVAALLFAACGTSATPAPTSAPSAIPTAAPTAAPTTQPTANSRPSLAPSPSSGGSSTAPTGSAGASTTAGAPLDWTDCGTPFLCATLDVPLDYSQTGGRTISLALIKLPATDPSQRIGSLVTNPGGPGGSGVDYVRQSGETTFSDTLRAHFDIIGFDPRGVGASTPFTCENGAALDRLNALDPTPDNQSEIDALVAGAKEFDASCQQMSGALLPFMTTVDVAKDLDRIREALGEGKLNYLGFSYGTFIGSTYAGLFPHNIRALVLDGPIDPTQTLVERSVAQAEGFSGALDRFFADCAARPTCAFYNDGHPAEAFDKLMASIDANPIPASFVPGNRMVGPGEAFIGMLTALYSRSTWPYLEQALKMAQNGDGSVLLQLADAYNERNADGQYSNESAVNNAVNCSDYAAPTDVATYEDLATKVEKLAPRFGAAVAYSGLTCAFWPIHPKTDPGAIAAPDAPPIVIVATTGDPATPYSWGQALAKQMKTSVLLTRVGEGHTAYGDSVCIQNNVDQYLISLKVPAAGTTCK